MVGVEDAEHVQHAGSLAKKDVGADGISRAPFMNDQEAESLNISQAWVIKVVLDELVRLAGVAVRSIGWRSMATNQGGGAPERNN